MHSVLKSPVYLIRSRPCKDSVCKAYFKPKRLINNIIRTSEMGCLMSVVLPPGAPGAEYWGWGRLGVVSGGGTRRSGSSSSSSVSVLLPVRLRRPPWQHPRAVCRASPPFNQTSYIIESNVRGNTEPSFVFIWISFKTAVGLLSFTVI